MKYHLQLQQIIMEGFLQKGQKEEQLISPRENNTPQLYPHQALSKHSQLVIGDYDTAPSFMRENEYITGGYRINFSTPRRIITSLFMLHNESVSIWMHLIPALLIIIFFASLFATLDTSNVKLELKGYQQQLKKSMDSCMHAINNLSLISKYDQLQNGKKEIKQLKQTAIKKYQVFSKTLQTKSAVISSYLQNSMGGMKNKVKNKIKHNLAQFQRAKKQFQRNLAPFIVSKVKYKLKNSWLKKLKGVAQRIKRKLDSKQFQFIELHKQRPNPQEISRWPIVFFLSTALICLLASTLYHLFYQMSPRMSAISIRFDYAGVSLLMAGSTFPPVYYGMYCNIDLALIYLTLSIVISFFCFIVLLFQWIHMRSHAIYKAFLFIGTSTAVCFPIIHMMFNEFLYDNYGDRFKFSQAFPYVLLAGAAYNIGLQIYTVRCPERYDPGKYNICGHSHQIWHVMVVLGIIFTYLLGLQCFEMRKRYICPK